jgi:hypothetical protein
LGWGTWKNVPATEGRSPGILVGQPNRDGRLWNSLWTEKILGATCIQADIGGGGVQVTHLRLWHREWLKAFGIKSVRDDSLVPGAFLLASLLNTRYSLFYPILAEKSENRK